MYLARANCVHFYKWVRDTQPMSGQSAGVTVSDYVYRWLRSTDTDVVRKCTGSFSVYLQTAILIILEWQRQPERLDYQDSDGATHHVLRIDDWSDDDILYQFEHEWLDAERFAAVAHGAPLLSMHDMLREE
jgi:hypothetical protein